MYKKYKISVVIPCYKVSRFIGLVVSKLPPFLDKIYLVDDKCPEYSVKKLQTKNKKIVKIYRKINGGVGAAVKTGYRHSLMDKNDITIRVDGDAQMDLKLMKKFIDPIIDNKAEFTKGNRFKNLAFLKQMPLPRIIGNIFFSIIGNIITKNFRLFDFLSGYTCIKNNALKKLLKTKIDNDYFFESALIYNATRLNIRILDINIKAIYGNEKSNINIKTFYIILYKNLKHLFKVR